MHSNERVEWGISSEAGSGSVSDRWSLRIHWPVGASMRIAVAVTAICLPVVGLCIADNVHAAAMAMIVPVGGDGAPTVALSEYSASTEQTNVKEEATSSLGGPFLVRADETTPSHAASVPSGSAQSPGDDASILAEVVVTAEKRPERLMDVPMSITSLAGDALAEAQEYRFEDYVARVPGLALIDYGARGSQLVIRGLTTGSQTINSSVATYIDETPYGTEGFFDGSFYSAPNLDTFDMQRIEVLKGPQGTLYGANALGGVLKYVTNAPDPSGFLLTGKAGVSSVQSGGVGFDAHTMINMPLTADSALRLVGYDTYYPGFIDDPSRGVTDINGTHYSGGRASLLLHPAAELSIRFNALYQNRSYGDWPAEDLNPGTLTPIYCNLCQERLIGQPGHTANQLYSATIDWSLGFATLLSSTSYQSLAADFIQDYSGFLGSIASSIFQKPLGVAVTASLDSHSWTQELRLSTSGHGPLRWQIGGFFTDEHSHYPFSLGAIDVPTRTILPYLPYDLNRGDTPVTYREYAGFANVDYSVMPNIDVALGGRYSENHQTYVQDIAGLLTGPVPPFENKSSQNVLTYSGDLRWRVTTEAMLYARIASGFVPGGPNDVFFGAAGGTGNFAASYKSSTTINYEAGLKSTLLDGRLTLQVSAFDIDWRDIQLNVLTHGFTIITNGGNAKSDGVEWTFAYAPIQGLTVGFSGDYTDAHLTQNTPPSAGGHSGDRLPSVPLWQSSATAEYRRPIHQLYDGFVGASWVFTGSRYADFEPASPRQQMPSFDILNLHGGLQTQKWTFALYIKNVGNKKAINYLIDETGAGGSGPQSAVLYQPRTLGATFAASF